MRNILRIFYIFYGYNFFLRMHIFFHGHRTISTAAKLFLQMQHFFNRYKTISTDAKQFLRIQNIIDPIWLHTELSNWCCFKHHLHAIQPFSCSNCMTDWGAGIKLITCPCLFQVNCGRTMQTEMGTLTLRTPKFFSASQSAASLWRHEACLSWFTAGSGAVA